MKRLLLLAFLALGSLPLISSAQNAEHPAATSSTSNTPNLIRFNLDFAGGTPHQLVAAIEKASGRPLNVVIPQEYTDYAVPPLKLNRVNVAELFRALAAAVVTRISNNSYMQTSANFTPSATSSALTDDTVWTFVLQGAHPSSPASVRFYLLTPYLDAGLTVDDITTAVRTAWKMSGLPNPPALSFHAETKLLIASGDPYQIQTIDAALSALDPVRKKAAAPANESQPKKP